MNINIYVKSFSHSQEKIKIIYLEDSVKYFVFFCWDKISIAS